MSEEKSFKFDVVIGNPPYQEETHGKETKNGQKRVKSIFHLFQEQVEEVAEDTTALIYPGGRWIHRSGKGMQKFGLKQINDPHLEKLVFYPNSNEVFANVSIADGVSIVYKDMHKTKPGFQYEYVKKGKATQLMLENPGEQLMPLDPEDTTRMQKVNEFVKKIIWLTCTTKYSHKNSLGLKVAL